MKKKFKIKNKYISIIFIFIFLIIFLNFISAKSDKFFNLIGFRTYTVLSGSMEPDLYPGDIVVVINKNKINFNIGDIITFKKYNTVITHRIIDLNNNGYITKGDNNNFKDSFIVENKDIIGKVLLKIPKLGYILEFLSRPIIISLEMILLGILIIRENILNKN